MANPYPVGLGSILPGNQSFIIIAAAGATTGALRIDHMGGTESVATRRSEYGASDSIWIRFVANKFIASMQVKIAEDIAVFESLYTLGALFDIYVKRSSGATTYDKIGSTMLAEIPKEVPEDGNAHRTIQITFEGGIYTAGVAAGTLPTLAP